jgi:hypothetical protein
MNEEIKIINADEAEQIDPDMPDAGWKRDEELAKRTDALEQVAEETIEEREVYAFDPAKFKPDNEILQFMDELEVIDKQPGRAYLWCYEGQNSRFVTMAMRLGYVVVKGDDPECAGIRDARGYRKIGDVILLWIPQDRADELQKHRDYKRLVQQEGVEGALREMSEKYKGKGVSMIDPRERKIGSGGSLLDAMGGRAKAQGARQAAMKGVDTHLRQGTVPGMPAPGKGRR